ncbi:hypothetical protein HO173_003596 [Letharia columbiana]|uniref:SMP domain-containing protein n=1 Tax=Letharia columbiana TaxID=112416 RepID=A0A8H6G0L2_9LECA|nr:uncharacterized protein HO173_003596 [Letharia columbiana]KAF6238316.1 hypothetical protein HO173_003596 [Letharia columbiana]
MSFSEAQCFHCSGYPGRPCKDERCSEIPPVTHQAVVTSSATHHANASINSSIAAMNAATGEETANVGGTEGRATAAESAAAVGAGRGALAKVGSPADTSKGIGKLYADARRNGGIT